MGDGDELGVGHGVVEPDVPGRGNTHLISLICKIE
jgi:hypothetical protein